MRLWNSPSLRSGVVYAVAGVGFAGANLLLARALPTEEYALFTLALALVNLGYSMAPLGLDGVVNRRRLEAGPVLLRQTVLASLGTALLFAGIARIGYQLSVPITAMVSVSCAAGGAMVVASANFQSESRFGTSLALAQSPNAVLLVAALVAIASHAQNASLPILMTTAGFVVAAAAGWSTLLVERHRKPYRDTRIEWLEAFSFAGLNASGLLLINLERLVIPHVLPLVDLAIFGVLAAIAGSLFRVLQMGVGFSLLPRLRSASGVDERRRLVAHEAQLVGLVALLGALAIWFFTPHIVRLLVGGKYHLGRDLVFAAIVSGVLRVADGFTKAVTSALAEPRELSLITILGWVSALVAAGCAYVGARWGLAGVIYGAALGWLLRGASASALILHHLRHPVRIPVVAQ